MSNEAIPPSSNSQPSSRVPSPESQKEAALSSQRAVSTFAESLKKSGKEKSHGLGQSAAEPLSFGAEHHSFIPLSKSSLNLSNDDDFFMDLRKKSKHMPDHDIDHIKLAPMLPDGSRPGVLIDQARFQSSPQHAALNSRNPAELSLMAETVMRQIRIGRSGDVVRCDLGLQYNEENQINVRLEHHRGQVTVAISGTEENVQHIDSLVAALNKEIQHHAIKGIEITGDIA